MCVPLYLLVYHIKTTASGQVVRVKLYLIWTCH